MNTPNSTMLRYRLQRLAWLAIAGVLGGMLSSCDCIASGCSANGTLVAKMEPVNPGVWLCPRALQHERKVYS